MDCSRLCVLVCVCMSGTSQEDARRDATSSLRTCSLEIAGHAVHLFCNSEEQERSSVVPVLTVGAADARQEMERLKQLLRRLGDGVADAKAANKITFSIGAAEMDDVFDFGHTLDGTGAAELAGVQRIVANFLRSHLFDVWHTLVPELHTIHGRFYIYDPFVKDLQGATVNNEWHQDGKSLVPVDDFFAHYYFADDDADATGIAGTGWSEVAIPAHESGESPVVGAHDDDDDDAELAFDWSGMSDDTRKQRIAAENFVALRADTHALIILHDAECFHRVPLAALHRQPSRTIARAEFRGVDASGAKLHFVLPAEPLPPLPPPQHQVQQEQSETEQKPKQPRWEAMAAAADRLPPSLAALCDGYNSCDRPAALGAYIRADAPLKRWLEEALQASGRT